MLSGIFCEEKLQEKAEQLKQRGFRPGYDGMTADGIAVWVRVHGEDFCRELLNGRYEPMPALGFVSAEKDGGYRLLCRLTAIDTVVQLCILEALTPVCEERFSEESFAYRPGRGMSTALGMYCRLGMEYPFAARMDIKSCFDDIDHAILSNALHQYTRDKTMDALIMRCVCQPLFLEGNIETRSRGLLQGSPLSPLLSSIYLDNLDKYFNSENTVFIRYGDEIVLFGSTAESLQKTLDAAQNYLDKSLKLQLNEKKTIIDAPVALHFLGHCFDRDRAGRFELSADGYTDDVFYGWYDSKPQNTFKTWNVLSDGILRQKDMTLYFESEISENSIPINSVERLNIFSDVVFDSRVLQKAMDEGIFINIFSRYGKLIGRFVPNTPLKSPQVTFEQLQVYYKEKKRLEVAKEFVLAFLHNARLNIRYYAKRNKNALFDLTTEEFKKLENQIKDCKEFTQLLVLEEQMRKVYYDCFDFFIRSNGFVFEKRTSQPPENEVNSLLSFGNTILYNSIATRIYKTALDIRVGYFHATNDSEESLNLDVAEIFKPLIVDRVVFSLVNMKQIKLEHFTSMNDGVYLTAEGKRIYLRAFHAKLAEGVTIDRRFWTYDMLIDEEIRKLVRRFRHDEKYRAFRQVR